MTRPPKGFLILILGLLMSISPFAIDMYLPAFQQIATEFKTTSARISLSIASYFVGLAFGQLMYGPLLDRYGRKKPLFAGLILFMVSSIGCMLSTSVEALVAFRFTQALGGCVAWVGAMSMVRDFFPMKESSKIFSLLILVLGASPLLAPTIGGFITVAWGWPWIFFILTVIVFVIFLVVLIFLPEGHKPDPTISLRMKPMWNTFMTIAKEPQFFTYNFAGALAFATLFIYVSGSPVIFMEIFHIDPRTYGGIFALISIGFIGGSQLNIFLTRKYSSATLFRTALRAEVVTVLTFLLLSWLGCGVEITIIMIFIAMACVGILNPNASTLALAPFTRNIGSASALIGCTQITIAALVSAAVGLIREATMIPIVGLMAFTVCLAILILWTGEKRIGTIVEGHAGESGIL